MATQTADQALQSLIDEFNKAWQSQAFDKVNSLLHPQVVFVTPAGKEILGREACVNTFQEFMTYTNLLSFEAKPADIHSWGMTATIRYVYQIEYDVEGEKFQEGGIDVWVMQQEASGWQIVWRALLPM